MARFKLLPTSALVLGLKDSESCPPSTTNTMGPGAEIPASNAFTADSKLSNCVAGTSRCQCLHGLSSGAQSEAPDSIVPERILPITCNALESTVGGEVSTRGSDVSCF